MLRWLALWLLHLIEGKLDPELQARLDKYRKQKADLEAQETEALTQIAGLEGKLAQLNSQRAATQAELAEAERAASRFEEERKKILDEKDNVSGSSDHDALRDRL
jgi:septal ring factor EnvC (AmiA/AmiB activator)